MSQRINALLTGPKFTRSADLDGAGQVIAWWESRRMFYNGVVGCTGVITCILLIARALTADLTVGEPIGMPDGPLLGVFFAIFYGIVANVIYTGGWIGELTLRGATTAKKSASVAVMAFRTGLVFSVLITFVPAAACWIVFAVALFHGQKHGPPGE